MLLCVTVLIIAFTTCWVPAKPPVNWQRCPGTEQKLTARLEEYVRKAALIWVHATLRGSNILLMERTRLTSWGNGTFNPIICRVLYIPGGDRRISSINSIIIPYQGTFEDDVPFAKVAYVSSFWRVHRSKLRWFHLKSTQLKSKTIWTKSLIWLQNVKFPGCCFFMSYCHPCFHHVLFAFGMGDDAIRLLTIHIYIIYLFNL